MLFSSIILCASIFFGNLIMLPMTVNVFVKIGVCFCGSITHDFFNVKSKITRYSFPSLCYLDRTFTMNTKKDFLLL